MKNLIKNRKLSVILLIFGILLAIYIAVTIISTHSKIRDAEAENVSISEQISLKEEENEALKDTINSENKDDYMERVVREDYDYAGENERVYYASDAS